MAVQVRVKDFQSIVDASVSIDGLTVVTGANNSGKTAFMRAIRGVFTNAPPGPLVRHGCAYLSVSLVFDDGTSVLWEKGWEKPGRKGKTINRYTVNGKQIATVGRGVPPEVEGLGVREISAASDRVWPQIAQQFDGTLFLVNRPGSAVAEALSDVERVGALSSALKASEKDRRTANAELKVRRKDVETHKQTAEQFDGLDVVGDRIRALVNDRDAIQDHERSIRETTQLQVRLDAAREGAQRLSGFDPTAVPTTKALKLKQAIEKINQYLVRWDTAREAQERLEGFAESQTPDGSEASSQGELLIEVRALQKRQEVALSQVLDLSTEADELADELAEAEAEVNRLLGDRGVCPTCNTVHEGAHT
jgi:DNA repair ATPase RecN